MFASVREATFDPEKRRQAQAQLEEFAALRERQPGYAGVVAVDAGDGRVLTLVLWESEAHAEAAGAVLEPESQRLLAPLATVPGRFIAQGPVLRSNLVAATSSSPETRRMSPNKPWVTSGGRSAEDSTIAAAARAARLKARAAEIRRAG